MARFFFALAETSTMFYVGGAISTLGPIASSILKSMVSKQVDADERGKVFSICAVFNNAGPFIGGILYAKVFIIPGYLLYAMFVV